jgi:hypothetical protein
LFILIFTKKSLKIPKGGNQNPYIEEDQTTQWPKEKIQKDKQRSTKHTYKTKDRVTRTLPMTGVYLSIIFLLSRELVVHQLIQFRN